VDITRVLPVPTPVVLAGRTWLVRPLQLRQVAELQGWLAHVADRSPLAAHRAAIAAAPEGHARDVAAARAYLALEAWPIRFGSREASPYWSTPMGARFFLHVALERAISSGGADPDPKSLSPAEWAELGSAAFGADPLEELVGVLEPTPEAIAEPMNWAKAFAEVARETGWTFEQIGELTVGQFLAYRTRGEVAGGTVAPRPGETIGQAARRRAAVFAEAEALGPLESSP
jgi:hypothetical protein